MMRLLLVDDSDLIRRGVRSLLSSQTKWEICGEARDGTEAMLKARELVPDLILIDVSMPGISGLEATRLLRQELPNAKILVMSQHDPQRLSASALGAGANACLDKGRLYADLLLTIASFE
jgi:DNA-binding NarL/FixJ family response regulator